MLGTRRLTIWQTGDENELINHTIHWSNKQNSAYSHWEVSIQAPQHSLWFPSIPITLNPFLSIREMNSCHMFHLLLVRHMKASHLTQVCESSRETWGPRAPCVLASLIIIIFHAAEAHRAHPPVSPTVTCFWNCGAFHRFGTHMGPCHSKRRSSDFRTLQHRPVECLGSLLRSVLTLLPLFCLNLSCSVSASWHNRKPLSKRSMKVSEVISRPDRGGYINRRINSTIKCSFLENMHKEI